MGRRDEFSTWTPDRPAVYALTDRQLADEYSGLTGALVRVPSRRSMAAWWVWRINMEEEVRNKRASLHTWLLTD